MIDNHRAQIAGSDSGSVDSVLGRHKKVKQSVGDSIKLGFDKVAIALSDASIAEQSLKEENKAVKDYSRRLEVAKTAPLKKALQHAIPEERSHAALFRKVAMLPNQPPPEPKIQQEWRGRPKKMTDTANVAGTMDHVSTMLSPASTTAQSE